MDDNLRKMKTLEIEDVDCQNHQNPDETLKFIDDLDSRLDFIVESDQDSTRASDTIKR